MKINRINPLSLQQFHGMCGIGGIFNINGEKSISLDTLENMAVMMRHRGPDGFGFYRDLRAGLAHTRLSIIDIEGGSQPIHNEDQSIHIVFNGEIFNYVELREDLISRGHSFYTKSDTEVIVHAYEEYGVDCVNSFNGQFAFAIWDKNNERLFIARDRVGIRPLFYTFVQDSLLFASEVKSLFVDQRMRRTIDYCALDQIFTFWMTIPPRTVFKDVFELPAGHYMTLQNGTKKIRKYWDIHFDLDREPRSEGEYAEQLRELLIDSTRLRLRADVPVGAYLSGGIDSSVITTLIKRFTQTALRTFSVTFSDDTYDESTHQKKMIDYLETDHSAIYCDYHDIGVAFPDVIWHAETPVLRTAPAPLFLLSRLVRNSDYKVVLTGEGSDEILAGYDIFKETKIRKFIQKYPESKRRPLILKRLYPYLANSPTKSLHYAEEFFSAEMSEYPREYYSHYPRWNTTSKIKLFYSSEVKDTLRSYNVFNEFSQHLSDDVKRYDYLSRAQYIEMKTLLSGYLLSSQGDRVLMANSVEGRFPFLDHRIIEFCSQLPPNLRMSTLTEKYILKQAMSAYLPASIVKRRKQPYMAPDSKSFFQGGCLPFVEDVLSDHYLCSTGYFNVKAVSALVKKCRNKSLIGFKDNMAIVGILSTMLVHKLFIEDYDSKLKEARKDAGEENKYAVKV